MVGTRSLPQRAAVGWLLITALTCAVLAWSPLVAVADETTPTVPSSEETSAAPPPSPVRVSVRLDSAPVAARRSRLITLRGRVRASGPATVTVQYRAVVRGREGAWHQLTSRAVTGNPDPQNLLLRVRIPTRGLYQIRLYATGRGGARIATATRRIRVVGSKVVALTFDDGPTARTTPVVLEALKDADVPATFFVSGNGARRHPRTVKRMSVVGHCVANHSDSHRILVRLSDSELMGDLTRSKQAIEKVTGVPVRWLRPPYGSTSGRVKSAIHRAGMFQVIWSVDTLDWRADSAGWVISRALGPARDGSIILMHDSGTTLNTTGRAVPTIIKRLKSRGYDLVTLDEMDALGYPVER